MTITYIPTTKDLLERLSDKLKDTRNVTHKSAQVEECWYEWGNSYNVSLSIKIKDQMITSGPFFSKDPEDAIDKCFTSMQLKLSKFKQG